MAHWYTLEEAQQDWAGLGVPDAQQMQSLLDVSKAECLAFSPVSTTAPDPVTLTDGAATVTLSGASDAVTARVVTSGATAATVIVPADFRPVGAPRVDLDATNRAYFTVGNPGILDVVADAAQAFTMYWTAATPSAEQDIPEGHRWAHLAHARNIWNAQKVNPSGGIGDDQQGFALTPFPMDWSIKARLRPRVIFGGSVG
jgi:hypothetical protein